MNQHLETRRWFLQRGLAMLAAGGTVPTFLNQTLMAVTGPDVDLSKQDTGKDGKILVVVQLSGGNDGLNTIVPYADDAYHRARSGLAVAAKDVLRVDDYLGLHPNLADLKAIYDNGELSVVQGVGYPNPNRSHFRSMDIWHSAQPDKEIVTTGWLGRYFDNTCQGTDPHAGISIGETLPLSMQGERITPLSFEKPESYRYNGRDVERYEVLNSDGATNRRSDEGKGSKAPSADPSLLGRSVAPSASSSPSLDFLTRTAMDAQVSSDNIIRMARSHTPGVTYPQGEFAQGLKTIAAMIRGGLPTRVYYVSLGGFDTHAQQRGRHDNLMREFAGGVGAFWKDLKDQRNDERVLMMTFSEFGRRVAANASNGTDHGAAAPMIMIGRHIQPGVLGKHPSLTDLDEGDLKYGIDFRSVYANVLEQWLGTPGKPILGQNFKQLGVVKV